jgi:uncharacterized protein
MEPASQNSGPSFQTAASFELGIGFLAVFLSYIVGIHSHTLMPKISQTRLLIEGLVLGTGLGAILAMIILRLESMQLAWIEESSARSEEFLAPLLTQCNTWHLFTLSLCAGVGEELLFRGWLQGSLLEAMKGLGLSGVVIAVALASLIFGLAHPLSRIYVVVTGILGACLGISAYWSSNLLTAIVAHTVYDFILMVMFVRKTRA